MIRMHDALRLIERRREDAIVLATMTGEPGWREVSQRKALDLPDPEPMGKASSVGLGVSLARPDKKVIVIDGDGSLIMNLGTLVTIADQAPKNLYHVVLDNGVYAITGGQPVPNADGFSFAGLAAAAGYAAAFEFDDLEEFTTRVDDVMSTPGPVMVSLKTEPEIVSKDDQPAPGIWDLPKHRGAISKS